MRVGDQLPDVGPKATEYLSRQKVCGALPGVVRLAPGMVARLVANLDPLERLLKHMRVLILDTQPHLVRVAKLSDVGYRGAVSRVCDIPRI